jgi:hypothetical protein
MIELAIEPKEYYEKFSFDFFFLSIMERIKLEPNLWIKTSD